MARRDVRRDALAHPVAVHPAPRPEDARRPLAPAGSDVNPAAVGFLQQVPVPLEQSQDVAAGKLADRALAVPVADAHCWKERATAAEAPDTPAVGPSAA